MKEAIKETRRRKSEIFKELLLLPVQCALFFGVDNWKKYLKFYFLADKLKQERLGGSIAKNPVEVADIYN